MKDSGIEWIGEIPEDWKVVKIKYNFNIISGSGFPIQLQGNEIGDIPVIKASDISSSNKELLSSKNYISKEVAKSNFTVIPKNSILFAKIGEAMKKNHRVINIVDCCADNNCQAIVSNSDININYSYYVSTQIDMAWFDNAGTIPCMNNQKFKASYIPFPSINTQKRIADFLDEKCAKIDSLKNDIEKQIETLEQYKKSVITEAVTKGINPDVKMKDSGIEWIGNVPKTWIVDNPKYHFAQRKDRAKYGLKQLTASQKYGVITQEEYMEKTGAKVVLVEKDFEILKLVCPGDFVIHMRSFQGGLEYSEDYGSISSAYVMLIPQKTIVEPRFYKWFFKSPVYIDALSSTSNLIRDGQAMRYANFIQLPIPIPPAEEQKKIADYLDSKCSAIDDIISTKKQQLEKLEEYKKSLIFEYVTGKKEV